MATRDPQKTKRATRKPGATMDLSSAVERLEGKVKTLQSERDALKAELAAARARLSELEATEKDAVNRIDWVIDSLHNILEEKA